VFRGGAEPVHQRGQVVQTVHAQERGRAGCLGQVPELVVVRGHQDGLRGDAGAGAVAGEDIGPVGQTEGAQQGEALEDVAHVLGVDGVAGGVRVLVRGGGDVGERGVGGER